MSFIPPPSVTSATRLTMVAARDIEWEEKIIKKVRCHRRRTCTARSLVQHLNRDNSQRHNLAPERGPGKRTTLTSVSSWTNVGTKIAEDYISSSTDSQDT